MSNTPLSHDVHEQQRKKTNILFVTPEYAGLIKTGGLGDVSVALPNALLAKHDVRILIPGYSQVINSRYPITVIDTIDAYANLPACKIGRMQIDNKGPVIYVVICPELYEREGTAYGDNNGNDWADNPVRFACLSFAAAEIAKRRTAIKWYPDLVHANDWPTALTPAYMAWQGQTTPSIFTIHNLAHQGLCEPHLATALGLPPEAFTIDSMEFYGKLSFLKAGIVYANHITTVSETYAREITTPAFGCGLEGLLNIKFAQGKLSGIVNGIDESWEPKSDPHLIESFGAHEWERKKINTHHLEQIFNLPHNTNPLFAVVSRLVHQKGVDLTINIADSIIRAGGRLVVMGRGESELEARMMQLAKHHPCQIGVDIGFDDITARRIFAGSDFLLMPSRFEPCGLSQLYAQRCASLPIARHTGGLADTIEDGLSGFLFHDANTKSYRSAVDRALQVFKRPNLLSAMRCRAMSMPRYWHQSIQPYADLYQKFCQWPDVNQKSHRGLYENLQKTN
jgi:starch synthase